MSDIPELLKAGINPINGTKLTPEKEKQTAAPKKQTNPFNKAAIEFVKERLGFKEDWDALCYMMDRPDIVELVLQHLAKQAKGGLDAS